MADKINWLPAALGAALGAGIILARLPDADRRITAAAALTGAALGYGVADFIEDRTRIIERITDIPGNIAGTLADGITSAGKTLASTTGSVASTVASGATSTAKRARSTAKRASKAAKNTVKGLKFW